MWVTTLVSYEGELPGDPVPVGEPDELLAEWIGAQRHENLPALYKACVQVVDLLLRMARHPQRDRGCECPLMHRGAVDARELLSAQGERRVSHLPGVLPAVRTVALDAEYLRPIEEGDVE